MWLMMNWFIRMPGKKVGTTGYYMHIMTLSFPTDSTQVLRAFPAMFSFETVASATINPWLLLAEKAVMALHS
jgi:hypothetical protein